MSLITSHTCDLPAAECLSHSRMHVTVRGCQDTGGTPNAPQLLNPWPSPGVKLPGRLSAVQPGSRDTSGPVTCAWTQACAVPTVAPQVPR